MLDFMPAPAWSPPQRGGENAGSIGTGSGVLYSASGGGNGEVDRESSPEDARVASDLARRRIRRDAREARKQASSWGTAPMSWDHMPRDPALVPSGAVDELRAGLYPNGVDASSRWASQLRPTAPPDRPPVFPPGYAAAMHAPVPDGEYGRMPDTLAALPPQLRSAPCSASAASAVFPFAGAAPVGNPGAACSSSGVCVNVDSGTSGSLCAASNGEASSGDGEDIDQLLRCCVTAHLDEDLTADGYSRQGGTEVASSSSVHSLRGATALGGGGVASAHRATSAEWPHSSIPAPPPPAAGVSVAAATTPGVPQSGVQDRYAAALAAGLCQGTDVRRPMPLSRAVDHLAVEAALEAAHCGGAQNPSQFGYRQPAKAQMSAVVATAALTSNPVGPAPAATSTAAASPRGSEVGGAELARGCGGASGASSEVAFATQPVAAPQRPTGGDASRNGSDTATNASGGSGRSGGRAQSSQQAQETLEKVFKPWCKQRATQLFRFAHKRFAAGEGRGGVVFQFNRTSDVANGHWPVEESGWTFMSQRSVNNLGIKTNHVISAVQRYSPQQQCVVIALVKEAKFDRFYFLNAPKSHSGTGRVPPPPPPPPSAGAAGDRAGGGDWSPLAGQETSASSRDGWNAGSSSWESSSGASGQWQTDADAREASQQQQVLPALPKRCS